MTSFTPHTRDLIQVLSGYGKLIVMIIALPLGAATDLNASSEEDAKTVAALDTKYQAAVKSNDAATMDQILADDFVLVTGRGKVSSKTNLIESARKKEIIYERQDEDAGTQKVRVWGDTAVVTALLWIKAVQGGKPADYKLWFSDTYVRTPTGWRYVFGQASLPLPETESK
jgi:ketosteroid isomerase-like protein